MGQAVQLSTASVPTDYCPPSIQAAWPYLVSLLLAELAGDGIIPSIGPTTPAPDDQDRPWFRINADGTPDRWYVFSGGSWIAKHPIAAGAIWMFAGLEADIVTHDGGEAGTVTPTTGPMWEKYSAADGRFPVGPGTIGTTTIGVGGTGGTHEHTLTMANIPPHTHGITGRPYVGTGNLSPAKVIIDDDYGSSDLTSSTDPAGGTGTPAAAQAINTLPPYIGIWFIRKTARTHWRL